MRRRLSSEDGGVPPIPIFERRGDDHPVLGVATRANQLAEILTDVAHAMEYQYGSQGLDGARRDVDVKIIDLQARAGVHATGRQNRRHGGYVYSRNGRSWFAPDLLGARRSCERSKPLDSRTQ